MSFIANIGRGVAAAFAPSLLKPAAQRTAGQVAKELAVNVAGSALPNLGIAAAYSAIGPGDTQDKIDSFMAYGPISVLGGFVGRAGGAGLGNAVLGGRPARLAALPEERLKNLPWQTKMPMHLSGAATQATDLIGDAVVGNAAFDMLARDNPSMQPALQAPQATSTGSMANDAIQREAARRQQDQDQGQNSLALTSQPLGNPAFGLQPSMFPGALDDEYARSVQAVLQA